MAMWPQCERGNATARRVSCMHVSKVKFTTLALPDASMMTRPSAPPGTFSLPFFFFLLTSSFAAQSPRSIALLGPLVWGARERAVKEEGYFRLRCFGCSVLPGHRRPFVDRANACYANLPGSSLSELKEKDKR